MAGYYFYVLMILLFVILCPGKFHLDEYVLLLCFGTAFVIAHPNIRTVNRDIYFVITMKHK